MPAYHYVPCDTKFTKAQKPSRGVQDFLPANRLTFPLQATAEWQTPTLEIPTTARVIHMRVHLPAGGAEFQEIELKAWK